MSLSTHFFSYGFIAPAGGTITYTPVVARPTPTGSIVSVNSGMSSANIASAYAGCVSGDCIEFAPGTYDQNACFPSGYNKAGVIIRAASRGAYDADPMGGGSGAHFARFSRNVTFLYKSGVGGTTSTISANNVTIQDIWHKLDNSTLWPADNSNWNSTCPNAPVTSGGISPFGLIKIGSGVTGTKIIYNEFSMGYGSTGDAFDPTFKYADCNSPATFSLTTAGAITTGSNYTGWGDATYLTYNRLLWGPYAIIGSSPGAGVTIYGNYFHDIYHALNGVLPAGGAYLQQHNWMERCYHDFGTISSSNATPPSSIEISQNIFIDPCGNASDNGNPHVDTDQIFWSITGGGTVRPYNMRASRNLLMNTSANIRAGAQFNFWQMSGGHYTANDVIAIAPKFRENIAIMGGSSHGGGDLGVSEDFYVRGNESYHPSIINNGSVVVGTALTVNSAVGISTARSNKGLSADNIYEADIITDSGGTAAVVSKLNNVVMGTRTSRFVSEGTIFNGNTASWPSNPYSAFELRKKKAGYTTLGTQKTNIADFVLAPLDFTGERPFLGFVDLLSQTAGTVLTSNPAWVHGGDPGDVLSIVPAAGTRWKTVSATDRTTDVQAWSTTSGTVTVDNEYVIIEATAPTQGTTVDFGPTLGGILQSWNINSLSTATYPTVQFSGANRLTRTGTTAFSTDSQKITIGIRAFFPDKNTTTYSASSINLIGDQAGNTFQILLLTTGALRFVAKNSSGTIICQWTSVGDLRTGAWHTILLSLDLAQTTAAAGFKAVIDGTTSGASPSAYNTTGTENIWFSRTGSTYAVFGNASSMMPNGSQLAYAYVSAGTALDVTSTTIQSKFNADQIGNHGAGPSGSSPVLFLVGNASQHNASALSPTGSQWGTGVAWGPTGGSVTDVNAGQSAWS